MKIKYGSVKSDFGPGVDINLTGDEVATAIDAYLVARGVYVSGPRTVTVNGELCDFGRIHVCSSGRVVRKKKVFYGRGPK